MQRFTTIVVLLLALLFSGSFLGYVMTDYGTFFNTACLVVMLGFSLLTMVISIWYIVDIATNKEKQHG